MISAMWHFGVWSKSSYLHPKWLSFRFLRLTEDWSTSTSIVERKRTGSRREKRRRETGDKHFCGDKYFRGEESSQRKDELKLVYKKTIRPDVFQVFNTRFSFPLKDISFFLLFMILAFFCYPIFSEPPVLLISLIWMFFVFWLKFLHQLLIFASRKRRLLKPKWIITAYFEVEKVKTKGLKTTKI